MAEHIKTEAPDEILVGASVIFLVVFSCAIFDRSALRDAAQPDFREYKEATQTGGFLYGGAGASKDEHPSEAPASPSKTALIV